MKDPIQMPKSGFFPKINTDAIERPTGRNTGLTYTESLGMKKLMLPSIIYKTATKRATIGVDLKKDGIE